MNIAIAGLLSVVVLACLWIPVCFVVYVFCERQFTLRLLFIGVTVFALSIGTLLAIQRLLDQ
jgi:hypothetical protein